MWHLIQGSSGWGDAIVMVPWELWRAYGDLEILRELWPAMVGWLDYAAEGTHAPSPEPGGGPCAPLAHEAFLWDGGFHWGEWLEPGVGDVATALNADQGSVGTAYLHRSGALAATIGAMLGHDRCGAVDELADNSLSARGEPNTSRPMVR